MKISGWGRYPVIETDSYLPRTISELKATLNDSFSGIARAMGRSYGDSSLAQQTINTLYLNQILAFDKESGIVECAAGVTMADLLETFVVRGWFPPVTAGTKYISIGGAIASDIHGKNHHHSGCFSEYILSIKLMLANGEVMKCSKEENADLFHATCGGMGLTGIILSAKIKLLPVQSAWISQTTQTAGNLKDLFELFETHQSATYSVAWLDSLASGSELGRSVFICGEHASHAPEKPFKARQLIVPLDMSSILLNKYLLARHNNHYFNRHKTAVQEKLVHYEPFFYPLDHIDSWNRLYGKKGLLQYQFVLPKENGQEGILEILTQLQEKKYIAFLAVLKEFVPENNNYLSFPMAGYALALDFKFSEKLLDSLAELDKLVLILGGRMYLAKDALISEDTFKQSYHDWRKLVSVRKEFGADKIFHSVQSQRLGI